MSQAPWKMDRPQAKNRARSKACEARHLLSIDLGRNLAALLAGQAGGILHLPKPADNEPGIRQKFI